MNELTEKLATDDSLETGLAWLDRGWETLPGPGPLNIAEHAVVSQALFYGRRAIRDALRRESPKESRRSSAESPDTAD